MAEPNITNSRVISTACCIAGGGPAGMVLGYLLARAGIDVTVLEKHPDFLRDFRGDTIHPSTLEVIKELGLLDELLKQPHQKVSQLKGFVGQEEFVIGDLTHLPTACKYIAMMPQWDFLNFFARQAERYKNFRLLMNAKATDLIDEHGTIKGVLAKGVDGPLEIRAPLVIGADGRHSILREKSGLKVNNLGAPIDVLWVRISRKGSDPSQVMGRFERGKIFVMLYRGDYWQCAYVIPKDSVEKVKARGLEAFRESIKSSAPFLENRVDEIQSWDQVKLLTVTVDRLQSWYKPGLLFIGDSAHAMSPVGGVGINLAIQDAVATANILAPHLKKNAVAVSHLAEVQKRREWPTQMTQRMQVVAQKNILGRVVKDEGKEPLRLSWFARAILKFPLTSRIPAHVIGMGFRPEHIDHKIFS